ncbi:hypothetical protein D3C76_1169450 [compost metagenome]
MDAIMMLRNRSKAPGAWLDAIAPMFQVTGRHESRSVVPINRIRPLSCSSAILARICSVTYLVISRESGLLSAMPSLARRISTLRGWNTSLGPISVTTRRMTSSYSDPR